MGEIIHLYIANNFGENYEAIHAIFAYDENIWYHDSFSYLGTHSKHRIIQHQDNNEIAITKLKAFTKYGVFILISCFCENNVTTSCWA